MDSTETGLVAIVVMVLMEALKRTGVPERWWPLMALCVGVAIGVGVVSMRGGDVLQDGVLEGFLAGASAAGLWKAGRSSLGIKG